MYECYRCGYNSDRTGMSRHLLNKFKCKPIKSNIDLNECKEYLLNKYTYNEYIKIISDNTNNKILELNNINNKLLNEIQELKQELLNSKIELVNKKEKLLDKELIKSSKNNTINPVILVGFKDTYKLDLLDILTESEARLCFNNLSVPCIVNALLKIHFNKKKKQYMNIYISNMNSNRIQIYENNIWITKYFTDELEYIVDRFELTLMNRFDDWDERGINCSRERRNYDIYSDNKKNRRLDLKVLHDLKLALYNNRHFININ